MRLTLFDDRKKRAACFRLADESGAVIADIYRDDIAPLLAAAPELLEACKLMRSTFWGTATTSKPNPSVMEEHAAIRTITTAIAKAERKVVELSA